MPNTDDEILLRLKSEFQQHMPSGSEISREAVANALHGHHEDVEWIRGHFSTLVEDVQRLAYQAYLGGENENGALAIRQTFLSLLPEGATAEEAITIVSQRFRSLERFFLSITQGRKPRAGNAFEVLIRELFSRLGYPFSAQQVINGKPDFVLPSIEHFRRNAPDCIIFTVKRTLRERWRQIVTEGRRGLGFFLATIDENVGARDLQEMLESRIILVVPERLANGIEQYVRAPNVVSFETFFRSHLDPAMARWRESGAVQ